ncbi:hypothetical protein AB3S75_019172 [Citrus x aurantiifolia]
MKESMQNPLSLKSLNHISLVCRSVEKSLDFYQNVLGFLPITRPGSFDFHGAWKYPDRMPSISKIINPKDNHISFQCENMATVERKLTEVKIEYVKSRVEEGRIYVDQVFFHDPDGSMIDISNCDVLPVVPLAGDTIRSCSIVNCNIQQRNSSGRFNHANETAMPF